MKLKCANAGGTEAGSQHVGGGPVVLLSGIIPSVWADVKAAAFGAVKKGAQDARGIKTRKAEPVN
jgi:hypothetical protein